MSRAFIREPDGETAPEPLPERPQSGLPNYIRPSGLAELKARRTTLEKERHERLAQGAERASLAQIERDLRWLESRIGQAIVVPLERQPRDQIAFGARVTLEDKTGGVHCFTLVGEDEADAGSGRLSWCAPLARALSGARLGESVLWQRPAGSLELTVRAIDYDEA
jgi:transcription elongation GreA/GreB family factor